MRRLGPSRRAAAGRNRSNSRVDTFATPPRERLDTGNGTGLDRPWNVIVLNDNHNTFEGVAFALSQTLPAVTFAIGLRIADSIDSGGRAIVWSGHREIAEGYWENLKAYGLTLAPLES
jgi:ATP-dependent Clp protease adaptor protein ClpS